jgi:hypothetical protein
VCGILTENDRSLHARFLTAATEGSICNMCIRLAY